MCFLQQQSWILYNSLEERGEVENTASLAAGITATSRAMTWWWHVTCCMRTCFCGRGRAPSRLVDFTRRRPKTVRSLMETDRHRPHVRVHRPTISSELAYASSGRYTLSNNTRIAIYAWPNTHAR
jgi:hypothetical protein